MLCMHSRANLAAPSLALMNVSSWTLSNQENCIFSSICTFLPLTSKNNADIKESTFKRQNEYRRKENSKTKTLLRARCLLHCKSYPLLYVRPIMLLFKEQESLLSKCTFANCRNGAAVVVSNGRETAALQSCDKEQQRSLIVKSRIGRRHASNLGLYFSHFRSDDKALGLSLSSSGSSCVVLAWKCTGVVAFFNLHRRTPVHTIVSCM